jgi:hypothetical protein
LLLVACSRWVLGVMMRFYLNMMPVKIEEYMSYELHETGTRERPASGVPFCNVSAWKTSIDEKRRDALKDWNQSLRRQPGAPNNCHKPGV